MSKAATCNMPTSWAWAIRNQRLWTLLSLPMLREIRDRSKYCQSSLNSLSYWALGTGYHQGDIILNKYFSQRDILNDCNETRTHNHLVRKWTLNHLDKLAKWLSYVLRTCTYGVFDCIILSCHVRVLEWIHTL